MTHEERAVAAALNSNLQAIKDSLDDVVGELGNVTKSLEWIKPTVPSAPVVPNGVIPKRPTDLDRLYGLVQHIKEDLRTMSMFVCSEPRKCVKGERCNACWARERAKELLTQITAFETNR